MGKRGTLISRFWEKVVKTDNCWKWKGSKCNNGYGLIGLGKREDGISRAHVVSWKIHFGDIPDGLYVCHKCDNPECSNPQHLFLGTPKDNMLDKLAKGRGNNSSKISKRQVVEIICLDGVISRKSLSNIYGLAASSLCRIVKGCQRREQKCAG